MGALIFFVAVAAGAWWYARRHSMRAAKLSTSQKTAPRHVSAGRLALEPQSSGGSTGRWVPLGEKVVVHGLILPGGVYVGARLDAVSAMRATEPALIDPELPVNVRQPDPSGSQMGYWPSYAEISPASRGGYLRWLEKGRPAGAYIGYVFLFFYGIERRVILDASTSDVAKAEVPVLLREVQRLLELYQENHSFRAYASDFLSTARFAGRVISVSELELPLARSGWDIPIEVKLAVGSFAADGVPLPGNWALAWALTSPEIPLRTPATRCSAEFAALFLARYSAAYGEGFRVTPNRSKLNLSYRPASASFGSSIAIDCGGLPDVTRQPGPTRQLAELAGVVTDELDAYSRYVGRHGDHESAGAVALLPVELARKRAPAAVVSLLSRLPEDGTILPAADVAAVLGSGQLTKLSKRDAVSVSSLLASQNVALEPDVRFGTANFSHHGVVALWHEEEAVASPGDRFAAAAVLLHLGVTVSASDGEVSAVEEHELHTALADAFELPAAGVRRLRAHLRWLLAERPGIAGVKARIAAISPNQRKLIARYLIAVAGADGHISPKEVDSLRRLYALLELDPASVHSDLHGMSAAGPVPVVPADADPGDFALPRAHALDDRRLAEVMSSTEQVTAVLSGVFVEEGEEEHHLQDLRDLGEDDDVDGNGVSGLDDSHTQLLRRLSVQPVWPRGEFEELANELGLLPSGALETVNNAAFALTDGSLSEGEDPIELDGHVLEEMLNA